MALRFRGDGGAITMKVGALMQKQISAAVGLFCRNFNYRHITQIISQLANKDECFLPDHEDMGRGR